MGIPSPSLFPRKEPEKPRVSPVSGASSFKRPQQALFEFFRPNQEQKHFDIRLLVEEGPKRRLLCLTTKAANPT